MPMPGCRIVADSRVLVQVLAGPGLVVQSGLIAAVAVYILPYGWGWTEGFLFGGILSATDPVAVIAILKVTAMRPCGLMTSERTDWFSPQDLGVLPDLRVLIEAESLLNDGTAIVLFQICESILTDSHRCAVRTDKHSGCFLFNW
jgi:sodium/hydrogen exchanger 10/11